MKLFKFFLILFIVSCDTWFVITTIQVISERDWFNAFFTSLGLIAVLGIQFSWWRARLFELGEHNKSNNEMNYLNDHWKT